MGNSKTFGDVLSGRAYTYSIDNKHFVCKDRNDNNNYCLFRTGENGGKCKFLVSVKFSPITSIIGAAKDDLERLFTTISDYDYLNAFDEAFNNGLTNEQLASAYKHFQRLGLINATDELKHNDEVVSMTEEEVSKLENELKQPA